MISSNGLIDVEMEKFSWNLLVHPFRRSRVGAEYCRVADLPRKRTAEPVEGAAWWI